jgi:hypothetical protein
MAAPTYPQYTDLRDAANHPQGNKDWFNFACEIIWNDNFLAEHERNGTHNTDLATDKIEIGTFVGNAVDDRNVALSDGTLDIKFIRIYSNNVANNFFRSETMAGDVTKTTAAAVFAANEIQSVGTGTFQLGDSNNVNQNAITFYYIVVGV